MIIRPYKLYLRGAALVENREVMRDDGHNVICGM